MAVQGIDKFELFALLPEHRLALCINPKVASMSINDALHRYYGAEVRLPAHRHSVYRWATIGQMRDSMEDWRRAMFVRHPLDRLHSAYQYHINKTWLARSANLRRRFHAGMPFRLFVDRVLECPEYDPHFMPQSLIAERVDFIGRFENMAEDWRAFTEWSGIDLPPLQHINANTKPAPAFGELTEYQHRRLREVYADDFERFGYSQ